MSIRPPDQVLPAPEQRELPPAPRLSRMLGPGVILVGLSLGSGEFVLWPYLTAQYGFAVFWACVVGVTVQFFLNMEIERYTLATGESAVTGFFRLSRVFGPVLLLCGTLPWIWPGWATGAAELLHGEPGGATPILAVGGLVLCGLALSLGPVVYRTVEVLQTILVSVIFVMLVILVALVVRGDSLQALWHGLGSFGSIPEGIELPVLLGALAFAGAGGTTNLAQSNYIKDKGYGMGKWIGRITSPLTGRDEAVSELGYTFEVNEESISKWRVWWRRANVEQFTSFYLLCLLSLTMFCLLTHALLGEGGAAQEGLGFIRSEADMMEERFGTIARYLFLGTGIIVLLTTELGMLDAVTRVATDVVKVTFLRDSDRWTPTRLYFLILWSLIAFGIAVLVGTDMKNPLLLLVLSAALNAGVMFLYSGMLLWLGLRTFKPPFRPGPVRIGALVFAFGFFGYFTVITVIDGVRDLLSPQSSESFRLDNGMQVVLERVEGHPIAAVGLAYRAGVFDEPEGRCGVSHVLEHLFLQGPTESFPEPFDTLTRGGPVGQPFMDVNAETMWGLTYFYALRPAAAVEETLEVFAEKMDGVRLTQGLLDRERDLVLGEIRNAAQMMQSPAIRRQLEALARYPKAGLEADVEALTLRELEAYRASQYRPDRAILCVYGEIDLKSTRAAIERLFGPLPAGGARPLEAEFRAGLQAQIATYPCTGASQQERDALRVAAAAWQQKLREHGRAYVELPADGSVRAVLFGDDPAPLEQTREELLEGLSETELAWARRQAGAMARVRNAGADPGRLDPSAVVADHARALAQAVIDRLLVEGEGGQRFLEALDSVTSADVRAAATRYLR